MRLLFAFGLAVAAFAHSSGTFKTSAGPATITPVFHASVVLETERGIICVDPWCNGDFTGLRPADLTLITGIHPDHLDKSCLKAGTEIDAGERAHHYRQGGGSMSGFAAFQKGLEGTGIEVRLRDWYTGVKK